MIEQDIGFRFFSLVECFEIVVISKDRVFNVQAVKNVVLPVLKHVIVVEQHPLNHVLMHAVQNDLYVTRELQIKKLNFSSYLVNGIRGYCHM